MPTYKINKIVGTLKHLKDDNTWILKGKNKTSILIEQIKKKFIIDKHTMLLKCVFQETRVFEQHIEKTEGDKWLKISVNNVKEKESWSNWSDMFQGATEIKPLIKGWTDKNEQFAMATYDNDMRLIMVHGKTIMDMSDDHLTMVVYQRNSPGTSRFDCTWCFHDKHTCLTSVHDKKSFDEIHGIVSNITDNMFDNGPDPYDWKTFLKTQDKQQGDEDDWIGVFAPLTSDEDGEEEEDDDDYEVDEDEEEEVEEEDELDGSETETEYESSEFELETSSEVSSDDMEGGEYFSEEEYTPVKRRRLN